MLLLKATCVLWIVRIFDCALLVDRGKIDNVVKATEALLHHSENQEYYFIVPSKDEGTDDRVNYLTKHLPVPVQIESNLKKLKDRKRTHVLILLSNLEVFSKFHIQLTIVNVYLNGFYTIVLPAGNHTADMDKIFAVLWGKFVFNVNIISQAEETIEMFTFMPYRGDGKCGDVSRVKTNEFDTKSMQWINKNFYPKKFQDLHNCPIRCGAFNLEPAIIIERTVKDAPSFSGFDVDIFNALLNSIHASVKYTAFPIDTGKILENGTGTGLLGRTMRGDVDASLRSWSLQLDRRVVLSETVSYFSDKLIMIMPLPVPLNPLLKFIRPMKLEVWCSIGAIVLIASVVISMFKLLPKNYYRMIIGADLRHEYLNILIGFVGLSQTTLPEKNFPRFLLMMFLIFCLIIRSLYLGSLFNMLKTDVRSREFVSIKDFYDAGFNFYVYETLSQRLDYREVNEKLKCP